MKLVSIGEATADYYPATNHTLVGGISLNYAVHVKRCGADQVAFVSRVGDDANGELIRRRLEQEQVDTSHLAERRGKSAVCTIELRANGDRYFPPGGYHANVLTGFKLNSAELTFIQQHDIAASHYSIAFSQIAFNQVMRDLNFDGKRVADFGDWADYKGQHPQIFPYLDLVDLAFISGDEETIAAFRPIASQTKAQLVITLAEQGSVALCDGNIITQPATPVEKIVDTTGCGDAFQAAFTVAYFRTGDVQVALAAGANHAAKTLQHVGAI